MEQAAKGGMRGWLHLRTWSERAGTGGSVKVGPQLRMAELAGKITASGHAFFDQLDATFNLNLSERAGSATVLSLLFSKEARKEIIVARDRAGANNCPTVTVGLLLDGGRWHGRVGGEAVSPSHGADWWQSVRVAATALL